MDWSGLSLSLPVFRVIYIIGKKDKLVRACTAEHLPFCFPSTVFQRFFLLNLHLFRQDVFLQAFQHF